MVVSLWRRQLCTCHQAVASTQFLLSWPTCLLRKTVHCKTHRNLGPKRSKGKDDRQHNGWRAWLAPSSFFLTVRNYEKILLKAAIINVIVNIYFVNWKWLPFFLRFRICLIFGLLLVEQGFAFQEHWLWKWHHLLRKYHKNDSI